jgi:hypothetical protein
MTCYNIIKAITSVPEVPEAIGVIGKIIGKDLMAKEYWDLGNLAMSAMLNSSQVVGHVKGPIHKLCGDSKSAKEEILAATRKTVVLVTGAGGFLVAGPVGAFVGGIVAGTAWDVVAYDLTDVETKNGLAKIFFELTNDPNNVLSHALELSADGMTGYAGSPRTGNESLLDNQQPPSTCAEPQTLNKLYMANPDVDFSQVRVNTIEVRNGGVVYLNSRFTNCQQYDLGTVNTDSGMVTI